MGSVRDLICNALLVIPAKGGVEGCHFVATQIVPVLNHRDDGLRVELHQSRRPWNRGCINGANRERGTNRKREESEHRQVFWISVSQGITFPQVVGNMNYFV